MLTEERRRYIMDVLRRDGKIVAADLSLLLDVSEDTVRRDLRELARAGLLQRVHGGALPRSPSDPRYSVRQEESREAKVGIAAAAARLVQPGQVVAMDAGTTTLQVARQLAPDLTATVVTNSAQIAVALEEHPGVDVIMAGGQVHKMSLANIGVATVQALVAVRADICFLGIGGIHPEAGISILVHEELFVKRAMLDGASQVVAVAAREKLGTVAPYVVGPLSLLTHLVTEPNIPDEELDPYRLLDIAIVQN